MNYKCSYFVFCVLSSWFEESIDKIQFKSSNIWSMVLSKFYAELKYIYLTVDMNFAAAEMFTDSICFGWNLWHILYWQKKEDTLAYVLEFVCMKYSYVKKHKKMKNLCIHSTWHSKMSSHQLLEIPAFHWTYVYIAKAIV